MSRGLRMTAAVMTVAVMTLAVVTVARVTVTAVVVACDPAAGGGPYPWSP